MPTSCFHSSWAPHLCVWRVTLTESRSDTFDISIASNFSSPVRSGNTTKFIFPHRTSSPLNNHHPHLVAKHFKETPAVNTTTTGQRKKDQNGDPDTNTHKKIGAPPLFSLLTSPELATQCQALCTPMHVDISLSLSHQVHSNFRPFLLFFVRLTVSYRNNPAHLSDTVACGRTVKIIASFRRCGPGRLVSAKKKLDYITV